MRRYGLERCATLRETIKLPRVRSFLVVAVACAFSVSACSKGSSGTPGPPPPDDQDAALSEAGVVDGPGEDAEDTGLPGPTGPDDAGVDDSAPPATDGGIDGGNGEDAASADAAADGSSACGSPSGTYTGSCTSCAVANGTLTCLCTNDSGSSSQSSLDLCTCPNTATISNANGVLTCCGNPGGSYTQTCDECEVNATILGCTCESDNGGFISSFIALCSCQAPSQISNTDGMLTCQ
jgi:CVNH domain